jgi:hypothetical protein
MDKIDKLIQIAEILESNNLHVNILWKKYFNIACNHLGIKDKKTINILFAWGEYGHNWKALWKEDSEYKDDDFNRLYKVFVYEAMYIADRLSIDRLFRCHWLYNQYKISIKEEIYKVKNGLDNI